MARLGCQVVSLTSLWIMTGETMSDLIYLLAGIAVFVVFAGYAVLLRRA